MKNSHVLSLDPSLRYFGWSIIGINTKESTIIDCDVIKTTPQNTDEESIDILVKELSRIIKVYKPSLIVFENPVGSQSARANISLGYVRAIVLSLASVYSIKAVPYTAKAVKKKLTGNRNSEKVEIEKVVKENFPEFESLSKKWNKPKREAISDSVSIYVMHQKSNEPKPNISVDEATGITSGKLPSHL